MTESPEITIGQTVKVAFETMALGGKAKGSVIGTHKGAYAVFAELAAPGDIGIVKVNNVVKRYVEGELIEVLEPSIHRVPPACEYFGECGGCNWQHIAYEEQVRQKADIISFVLARNGLGEGLEIKCLQSETPLAYRSRADITFVRENDRLKGGFLRRRTHDLLDVIRCPLLVRPLSDALLEFKKALYELVAHVPADWPFKMRISHDPGSGALFGQPRMKGSLREGLLGTYKLDKGALKDAEGTTLSYSVDGLKLLYDPFCFTQVNMDTNEVLVRQAIKALKPGPEDEILELYAGIGNFTMPIAKRAGEVFAVESAPVSAKYSKINARENSLSNITHLKMDSERACRKLAGMGRRFSKVLVDPPREGMGEGAVNALCNLDPDFIVSISCHPDTLAKDLKRFEFRGYDIKSVVGVDMFGQTFHTETITLLSRR